MSSMGRSGMAFQTARPSLRFISAGSKPLLPLERERNPVRYLSFLSVHEKRQPNISIMIRQRRQKLKMPSLQLKMHWQARER